MIYRVGIGLLFAAVAGCVWLYAIGSPGAAYVAWADYRAALATGDYGRAARRASPKVFALEARLRQLALSGHEADLARLPMLDLAGVLGIREAVFARRIDVEALRSPARPEALHAMMRRAAPNKPLLDLALLFVLPTGSDSAIAWVGHRDHAGSALTWTLAVAYGLKMRFERVDGVWRVDYASMLAASADANGYYAGPTFETRKMFFNQMLAAGDPAKQAALWQPLSAATKAEK